MKYIDNLKVKIENENIHQSKTTIFTGVSALKIINEHLKEQNPNIIDFQISYNESILPEIFSRKNNNYYEYFENIMINEKFSDLKEEISKLQKEIQKTQKISLTIKCSYGKIKFSNLKIENKTEEYRNYNEISNFGIIQHKLVVDNMGKKFEIVQSQTDNEPIRFHFYNLPTYNFPDGFDLGDNMSKSIKNGKLDKYYQNKVDFEASMKKFLNLDSEFSKVKEQYQPKQIIENSINSLIREYVAIPSDLHICPSEYEEFKNEYLNTHFKSVTDKTNKKEYFFHCNTDVKTYDELRSSKIMKKFLATDKDFGILVKNKTYKNEEAIKKLEEIFKEDRLHSELHYKPIEKVLFFNQLDKELATIKIGELEYGNDFKTLKLEKMLPKSFLEIKNSKESFNQNKPKNTEEKEIYDHIISTKLYNLVQEKIDSYKKLDKLNSWTEQKESEKTR